MPACVEVESYFLAGFQWEGAVEWVTAFWPSDEDCFHLDAIRLHCILPET